jgi:hypothetical protein
MAEPHDSLTGSSSVLELLRSSKFLTRLLLPGGGEAAPYKVLDYDATLWLHDANGLRATFRRWQSVQFLRHGVSAVLDQYWGDGIALTEYEHSAGSLKDTFSYRKRRYLVIGLSRQMRAGQTLCFDVERTALAAFTSDREWLSTVLDHPVRRMRCAIVFPHDRPVFRARLHTRSGSIALPALRGPYGRTLVRFEALRAESSTAHTIRWTW